MTTRIKLRRDTASNWADINPTLALGEAGYDTTNNQLRVGDGTTAWSSLPTVGLAVGAGGQIILGNGTTTDGGQDSIAIGTNAGIGQLWSTVAIGNNAGNSNQGASAIAIGRSAGASNQDWDAVAIGRYAGANDQQQGTVSIGYYTGRTNQRYHSIAIGSNAGENNQYWDAIAIGKGAGNDGQDHQTIAIGHRAGETNQVAQSVAIGAYAGNYQQGMHSIAVGAQAGNNNQGWAAVAIGENAGNNSQGFRGIAIGRLAGNESQGDQTVAIGALAGYNEQGSFAVAVGRHAGEVSQGQYAVAIGQEAGRGTNFSSIESAPSANWVSGGANGDTTIVVDTVANIYTGMLIEGTNINATVTNVDSNTNTITFDNPAFGDPSGAYYFFGQQGDYAIAIGAYASSTTQHANSIVLNASGAEAVSAGPGTMVVKTLRQVSGGVVPAGFYQTAWNPTTGEMIVITP